ncbi:MAG: septal ring lytic transglycosylase RlpA family protein [Sulfurifustis sp.]
MNEPMSAKPSLTEDRSTRNVLCALAAVATLALGACGYVPRNSGYYEDDGPPARTPVDVLKVPDAVPRDEPPSAKGNDPYTVFGVRYVPLTDGRGYRERGVASWYGRKFHAKRTSSGESYDMYAMTAAHRTLPLPTYVRVRNLQNGRSVIVRVNDRGPFLQNRLIDLSYSAAARLDMLGTGTALVEVESIGPSPAPITVAANAKTSLISTAEAAPTDAAADTPGASAPRLAVQVGAFQRYENAVLLRERLERAGFASVSIQSTPAEPARGATPLYRVRIGPVPNVERGDQLVAEVARLGMTDALLVVE